MLFQSLKKTLVFSVIAVFCYGIFVSCENPFSSSLGSKVDVEAPTITVLSPASGDFLRDTVTFTGEATAYRDLRRSNGEYSNAIQIMILDQKDESATYLPWTTIGNNITAHGQKSKTWVWNYDLDTTNFDDTLFLKIKFRVYDESSDPNRKPSETVQLVYVVKNNPSSVKLSSPSQLNLDSETNETSPQVLVTGTDKISGQVTDRRGIKPGYPRIKIWEENPDDPLLGEPFSNDDPEFGWGTLFLDDLDDPAVGTGTYADRTSLPVVNARGFVFRLWEYSIEVDSENPDLRKIVYDRSGGDPRSLPSGKRYRFRIKTSDTFFNVQGMTPRAPEGDEKEAIGYFPPVVEERDEAACDTSGPSYVVFLKSSAIFPTVVLDNEDIPKATLDAEPHYYLTPSSMKKIAVGKANRPDFQLQILAHHPDGIDYATLEYQHTAGASNRREFLAWDNNPRAAIEGPAHGPSQGYIFEDPQFSSSDPKDGHKGWWKDAGNEARGTYFCFTADINKKDANNNPIFYGSPESYTLIVKVYSKGERNETVQQYTVYLESNGPEVNIRSVRGWSNEEEPTEPGTAITVNTTGEYPSRVIPAGGMLFAEEPYIVNGNIQVAVDRVADQGILSAKWIVEPDKDDYLTAGDTMLAKLKTYRDNPNAAGIQFYNEITEGHMSGEIIPPSTDPAALATDKAYNLKFNTTAWNGNDLWLYVIAQDGVQNLGFVLQKIHVDEEGDKPVINVPTLLPAITAKEQLYWDGTSKAGNWGNDAEDRKNMLDAQGIELTFTDDDGILRSDIKISLKNLDSGIEREIPVSEYLNGRDYLISGNSRLWEGVLSQQIMAQALYAGKNPMPSKLPDGLYELNINIKDNIAAKVAIDRADTGVDPLPGDTPVAVSAAQKYLFVVQSETPVINIIRPLENSRQNKEPVDIYGTVISRLRIQNLRIVFNPAILSSRDLDLYSLAACLPEQKITSPLESGAAKRTTPVASPADFPENFTGNSAEDYYVYYWRIKDVEFDPEGFSASNDIRRFTMTARDGLYNPGVAQCTVEVDTTPPVITMDMFNFGRVDTDKVNGKVPVEINVYDFNGVGDEMIDGQRYMKIKWWVVRTTGPNLPPIPDNWNSPAPPAADGAGGQVRAGSYRAEQGEELGGGRYVFIFDTRGFTENTGNKDANNKDIKAEYHVYVMAEDVAGNQSELVKLTETVIIDKATGDIISRIDEPFTLDQESDYPVLAVNDLTPQDSQTVTNETLLGRITGEVSDDDGFGTAGITPGNYVRIRFPRQIPGTSNPVQYYSPPDSEGQWDNWKPITSGELVPGTEGRSFSFELSTATEAYFVDDGWKYYQINVVDEPEAGPLGSGNYGNPPGKNPDGAKSSDTNYITVASRQYPYNDADPNNAAGQRGYFQFMLKNTPPQIYFENYDPDYTHDTDYGKEIRRDDTVLAQALPNNPTKAQRDIYDAVFLTIWTDSRPAFHYLAELRDALVGGRILETTTVEEAYFYFGGDRVATLKALNQSLEDSLLTMTATGPATYRWDQGNKITPAMWENMLDRFNWVYRDGAKTDIPAPDGQYSIAIEAFDSAGNPNRVQWTFFKDNTGPEITFVTDINLNETRLVPGRLGEDTYIQGRFRDALSDINFYKYWFDAESSKDGSFLPKPTTGRVDSYGTKNRNVATWNILIPAEFKDGGPHYLHLETEDMAGNKSLSVYNTPGVPFLLDRTAPVVSTPDNMIVTTVTGATPTYNQKLAAHARIFSAAYARDNSNPVFTLSGLVYDIYLNGITVAFYPGGGNNPVMLELPFGTWTGGAGTDDDPYTPLIHEDGQLSVRRATAAETSGTGLYLPRINNDDSFDLGNLYVWSLVVRQSDLYKMLQTTPSSSIASPSDDGRIRRQITVTAQDRADHNSIAQDWWFYLDDQRPVVKFINPDVPSGGYGYYGGAYTSTNPFTPSNPNRLPARMDSLNMEFIASDGTNIKEIRYFIAQSTDGTGSATSWRFYNTTNSTWSLTAAQAPVPTSWPTLLTATESAMNLQATVSGTLNYDTPGYPFPKPEPDGTGGLPDGLYKVQLYITDYSIANASANPGNPTVPANTEVQFFIDTDNPTLNWGGADTKGYFRQSDLKFDIAASDPNGIAGYVTAELRRNNVKYDGITPVVTIPTAGATSSTITVDVSALTDESTNGGRYALVLSVLDRTGKPATDDTTLNFTLDNTAPEVTMDPAGSSSTNDAVQRAAITGRVQLRGEFKKSAGKSSVGLVAFAIRTGSNATAPAYQASGNVLSDTALYNNGWRFFRGAATNAYLMSGSDRLAYINEGTATANVIIPNTRLLLSAGYLGASTPATDQTFNGNLITSYGIGQTVNKLVVHFLTVDEAGNNAVKTIEYWVYPEGDRPIVDRISNPDDKLSKDERLLNGRIQIRGTAVDDVYVKNVWLRVFQDKGTGTFEARPVELDIPVWNQNTSPWAATADNQPWRTELKDAEGVDHGEGWYMVNGGGSSSVTWYAYINNNGELDPSDPAIPNDIRIQVLVEDSIWDDFANNNNGAWSDKAGLISRDKTIEAKVIIGAPRFEDELVLNDLSSTTWLSAEGRYNFATPWSNILETNVRGNAAYAVTVKHETGIEAIRWTQPDGTTVQNLLAGGYNTPYSSGGITARALPKNPRTGSITVGATARTFMIWVPMTGTLPTGMDSTDNKRHTIFTVSNTTVNAGTGILLEKNPAPANDFEWVVVIDIDSTSTAIGLAGQAKNYAVNLAAQEISKPQALTTRMEAQIPIDNITPEGVYNHNTRVAGSSATFGGAARDLGAVNGLSHVVLWFSRHDNNIETFVRWDDKEPNTTINTNPDFVSDGRTPTQRAALGIKNLPTYAGFQMPSTYDDSTTQVNYSSVVINQHDPNGNNTHHGHKISMGWANSGGDYPRSWYVELDSWNMSPGNRTAHFIVYDQAGNGQYYSQKLMVVNGIPQIRGIRLATDIRGDKTFTGITGNDARASGILGSIRTAFGNAATSTTNDIASGISEQIKIDTTRTGNIYSAVFDEPFNVRNKLLAMEMEVIPAQNNTVPRYYRLEYVSGARLIDSTAAIRDTSGIKAGRAYIINNPGNTGNMPNKFPWGALGAQGYRELGAEEDSYSKGIAFLALADGSSIPSGIAYGSPSVWELNSTYYSGQGDITINNRTAIVNTMPSALRLNDVPGATGSTSAEFVYAASAFGTDRGNTIMDFNPLASDYDADGRITKEYPFNSVMPATGQNPWDAHSLFIIRVFDARSGEDELFGDFALLSIRVNNNDKTLPYAQLYDLNPKSEEGQGGAALTQEAALRPYTSSSPQMGQNRARGSVWNEVDATRTQRHVAKSGHVEPRRDDPATSVADGTSLTSVEMGGAASAGAASLQKPFANANAFFEVDTVSGKVIVRGYAEDDQRIGSVTLEIRNDTNNAVVATNSTITLLNYDSRTTTGDNRTLLGPPTAVANNVSFTETIDLYRHRVEWAYMWDTSSIPGAGNVAGNFYIRVLTRTLDDANAIKNDSTNPQITRTQAANAVANATYDYFNQSYPASGTRANATTGSAGVYLRYNAIRVNIRPYITGFLRNQNDTNGLAHNTRSRQGRYMFARDEQVVLTGFNLQNRNNNNTDLYIGGSNTTIGNVVPTAAQGGNFGLVTTPAPDVTRYRILTIPAGATTDHGRVRLNIGPAGNQFSAINTAEAEREITTETNPTRYRPTVIQPWNVEYIMGLDGSELWDDFTLVHIWQSTNDEGVTLTANSTNNGYFRSYTDNWPIISPAMTIQPRTGVLHSSHNENGSWTDGNRGTLRESTNSGNAGIVQATTLLRFIDPLISSDIYHSPGTDTLSAARWAVSSIIGQAGNYNEWGNYGGIFINGPNGVTLAGGNNSTWDIVSPANSAYYVESNWYNASSWSGTLAINPRTTEQFFNSHIVTSYNTGGTEEYIHVSYYDSKDGSIKYKNNIRGSAGTPSANTITGPGWIRDGKTWVNLDGGFDFDDITNNLGTTQYLDSTQGNGATADYRYVRNVYATNGQQVTATTNVYQFGRADSGNNNNTTTMTAGAAGYISLSYPEALTSGGNYTVHATQRNGGDQYTNNIVMTVFPAANVVTTRVVNYDGRKATNNILARSNNINAGEHNAIAVTKDGYPVIAYYDATNQKLKLALSNSTTPTLAANWNIHENVIPTGNDNHFGTGQFVSIAIDTSTDTLHIAAMNTNGNLVYISGTITASTTTSTFTNTPTVQVVDSNGTVGRWCKISLDSDGNPWIAYHDTGYIGARDGVKLAYRNTARFYKGSATLGNGEDIDINGDSITGWEAMHVPTAYRVENPIVSIREHGRIGLECFPTMNVAATATQIWGAAVSYYATYPNNRYRIAYYVK